MALTVGTGPFGRRAAGRFNFTYDAPERVLYFEDSPRRVRAVGGYLAFTWEAVDEWWEEAERIGVHPRDPYHRCDVVASNRHVVVRVGGRVLADSPRPTVLFETGLPPRFYLAEDDLDMDLLDPTSTETSCPYKGTTGRYFTVTAGSETVEDAAWAYDDPHPGVAGIAGLIAFYNEKVDLEVDGDVWERPQTRFS